MLHINGGPIAKSLVFNKVMGYLGIEALAKKLALPESVWGGPLPEPIASRPQPATPFVDPDPFQEIIFPNAIAAKRAIVDYLNMPLAKLPPEELDKLNAALADSLRQADVIDYTRINLKPLLGG